MKLRIVTHVEHPELRGKLPEVWPEFMQHDTAVAEFWPQLYEVYPDFQLWLLDGRRLIGYACTINEPNVIGALGYSQGAYPPGVKDDLATPPRNSRTRTASKSRQHTSSTAFLFQTAAFDRRGPIPWS